jgi:hypothetical protein
MSLACSNDGSGYAVSFIGLLLFLTITGGLIIKLNDWHRKRIERKAKTSN